MQEQVTTFFLTCNLPDLLDSFTFVFETLQGHRRELANEWRTFVGRALAEEHLAYRLDDNGVVHPFVDNEFEVNRSATLDVLNEPRFGEARG